MLACVSSLEISPTGRAYDGRTKGKVSKRMPSSDIGHHSLVRLAQPRNHTNALQASPAAGMPMRASCDDALLVWDE